MARRMNAVKAEEVVKIEYRGCEFRLNYSVKFDKDFEAVKAILDKGNLTHADRVQLLRIYNPAWHDGGKIAGIMSFDSSATNCSFCRQMRQFAETHTDCICRDCYDYEQEHGFKGTNVINRHSLNMLIMSATEYTLEELETVNVGKINRINSSGDVPNETYAVNMLNMAHVNSNVRFAMWAKNTVAVIKAIEKVGKPDNMILIQSSLFRNIPVKAAKYFDHVFTVYDNKAKVAEAINAGAAECNGKKCADCGYKCYLNGWKPGQNIAELLRVSKARKAEIEKKTA